MSEAQLVERQFQGSVPTTLRVVGAVYVVLSGSLFLQSQASTQVTGFLWALTAGLGAMAFAVGTLLRRQPLATQALAGLAAAIGLLFVVHAAALAWFFDDPGQSAYILTLLAGGGYFLLWRPALAAFMVGSLAAWAVAAFAMGLAWNDPASGYVVAGAFVGVVAHMARRRHLHVVATGRREVLGTLEASEERFRSLTETAKDAILLVDEAGRLTYLNPAGLALFGLKPAEANGRFLSQVVSNGGTTDVEHFVGTGEVMGLRRDGSKFPAELSLARTQRGGQTVYTGVLRDITERKKAAAESRDAATREVEVGQLRKMNEFKTRFLNMAAHELNTPLTPLRLQLHLLKAGQMGDLNDRQSKAIVLLDRNVTRLSGLVGEILEVARLQSGKLKLSVQPVPVDEIVDEVIDSFGETARRVGVDVAFAGQQSLVVMADRNRLTQVLFNLVSNALKFTPAGGRITVEATPQHADIEVLVRDTGLGLTPEQIERLFQPFVQVHDPMTVTAAGTGLGLYISKGLVEAQGGTISCSSDGPGRGSTFRFTLPVADPNVAQVRPVVLMEDPMVRRLRELI